MTNKMCDLNNQDKLYRRVFEDFNPYGYNIYLNKKEPINEIKKYGRTNHNKYNYKKSNH